MDSNLQIKSGLHTTNPTQANACNLSPVLPQDLRAAQLSFGHGLLNLQKFRRFLRGVLFRSFRIPSSVQLY
jgi:hypothetical protein